MSLIDSIVPKNDRNSFTNIPANPADKLRNLQKQRYIQSKIRQSCLQLSRNTLVRPDVKIVRRVTKNNQSTSANLSKTDYLNVANDICVTKSESVVKRSIENS